MFDTIYPLSYRLARRAVILPPLASRQSCRYSNRNVRSDTLSIERPDQSVNTAPIGGTAVAVRAPALKPSPYSPFISEKPKRNVSFLPGVQVKSFSHPEISMGASCV